MARRVLPRQGWSAPRPAGASRGFAARGAIPLFLIAVLAASGLAAGYAAAQGAAIGEKLMARGGQPGNPGPMRLEADQVVYNQDGQSVTALGGVSIRYNGYTLTARKVTFLRQTKRVVAEGEARLVEPGGNVLAAERIDVTDNFREGFLQALAVETTERSRFSAESAERREGNVTVFQNGVYSACQKCVNEPGKPPFWQIKAAKIVHDQKEQTIYYEDARLEFLGMPLAYVPFFQHPDPSVKRKTGILAPSFLASETLGAGVQVPFYWAPADDWDVTFSPWLLSRQGLLADMELRKRTETGRWSVRGLGINQLDPNAFRGTSGERAWRGAIFTKGEFNINPQWKWGWDATILSDRKFIPDYKLLPTDKQEATSTLYLTGLGERNYFDVRLYQFQIFEDDDPTKPRGVGKFLQEKQPVVHPVVDYDMVYPGPVLGGELAGHFNMTSLSRLRSDIDLTRQVYGFQGNYTRFTGEVTWRRQFIDPLGQVFTPFLGVRGDLFVNSNTTKNDAWVSDGALGRLTPTAGLEYRYPILATGLLGNHIVEPIAQFVARPSETFIGRLPNEDAQSLVFDATNLFDADKFSGFDRSEGATRANAGIRYTFLPYGGGSLSALVGQSYHLAGTSSFADPRLAKLLTMDPRPLTAIGSGLDTDRSDYVSSLLIDTGRGLRLGASARFDNVDMTINRAEIQATGLAGPMTASVTYAYLRTPEVLYTLLPQKFHKQLEPERAEVQSSLNLRMSENWRLFGGVRYDIENSFLVNNTIGLGFDNDSFSSSIAYAEDTDRALTKSKGNRIFTDRVVYFRFGLRTLGDGAVSNSLLR